MHVTLHSNEVKDTSMSLYCAETLHRTLQRHQYSNNLGCFRLGDLQVSTLQQRRPVIVTHFHVNHLKVYFFCLIFASCQTAAPPFVLFVSRRGIVDHTVLHRCQ